MIWFRLPKIVLFVLLVAINGCVESIEYEDISSNLEYQSIINKSYKTEQPLMIHGVNMEDVIGKDVHIYSITPLPGMGGREILSKEKLEVGASIRLRKVLRCSNCYWFYIIGSSNSYLIDILSSDKYKDHDIYLREHFGGIDLVYNHKGQYILNSEYFSGEND